MVVLNKIYTRTGDAGTTALGSGERVAKSHLRIHAYGTVDETNACLGMVRLHTASDELAGLDAMLARIQNDLFDLGADLCVPQGARRRRARACASSSPRSSGWSARSTSSTANWRRCAPSCCRAGIRRPPRCIWPAPSAGGPSG
jgi:cob(I)alamin adenosyltransferase